MDVDKIRDKEKEEWNDTHYIHTKHHTKKLLLLACSAAAAAFVTYLYADAGCFADADCWCVSRSTQAAK